MQTTTTDDYNNHYCYKPAVAGADRQQLRHPVDALIQPADAAAAAADDDDDDDDNDDDSTDLSLYVYCCVAA